MNAHKLDQQKPVEDVAHASLTDNKLIGFFFYFAMVGFVIMRKNIGVRLLKAETVLITTLGLFFYAELAHYFSSLPIIGKGMSYASFKIFTVIYLVLAVYHLIKSFIESRKIPYTYTRSTGISHIQPLIFRMNLPFIGQSKQRLDAIVEPLVFFLIAELVYHTVSYSLGIFLMIVSFSMVAIGAVVIRNEDEYRHSLNDSQFLARKTKSEVTDKKVNSPTRVASKITKPSQKQS